MVNFTLQFFWVFFFFVFLNPFSSSFLEKFYPLSLPLQSSIRKLQSSICLKCWKLNKIQPHTAAYDHPSKTFTSVRFVLGFDPINTQKVSLYFKLDFGLSFRPRFLFLNCLCHWIVECCRICISESLLQTNLPMCLCTNLPRPDRSLWMGEGLMFSSTVTIALLIKQMEKF